MDSPIKPRKRRWFARHDRHAITIGLVFVTAVLAAIALAVRTIPAPVERRLAATPADDDLTTGSIIFVPLSGDVCRNRLIDNATWRIRDNGTVDCRTALARYAAPPRLGWSPARIDIIRQGFTNR